MMLRRIFLTVSLLLVSLPAAAQTSNDFFDDSILHEIRIEIRTGQVTLRGTVSRSQDAWDFVRLVRGLNGVAGVTNSLTTAP